MVSESRMGWFPEEYYVSLANKDASLTLMRIRDYYLMINKKVASSPWVKKDGVWYLAKSIGNWEEECGLTTWKARNAVKVLSDLKVITTKVIKFNGVPTSHLICHLFDIDSEGALKAEVGLLEHLKKLGITDSAHICARVNYLLQRS